MGDSKERLEGNDGYTASQCGKTTAAGDQREGEGKPESYRTFWH